MRKTTNPIWPLDDIYGRPGHLIRRLQQIAVGIFMEETKSFDITPPQYATLLAVEKIPGIAKTQLADTVALDRSTIGELVLRLEARGLISRSSATEDRRVKKLKITAAGRRLLRDVEDAVNRAQEKILAPLAIHEAARFQEMLSKLVDLNNQHSRAPLRVQSGSTKRRSAA
jgi:DNA-binding MarR family transcriptional regulator